MMEKFDMLWRMAPHLTAEQLRSAHDKWDRVLGQFMSSAESACMPRKTDVYAFSPGINLILKRRKILKWVLRWHEGKVTDTRNLIRATRQNGIVEPLALSKPEVEARLFTCIEELQRLKQDAPSLRRQHLNSCL
jgi:hypothetical protein